MNYTAFIIPAFFTFLALEYFVARRKKIAGTITFENSISNITIGIAERLLNLLITASCYSGYYYIYENFAAWEIPNHWTVWVMLLMATDLVWYWYHRLGHEINLMWGAHIVHHQSEEFNYTVSARITTLQAIIRNIFWCVLPFAGFHPAMVITILVVHGTYSFFTHTETIGKLGWLENFLITPSHHRVHHASNDKYLNKNYGDIFVFWDKLFGTFQKEEEKPAYGLTHPLRRHSFIWQHIHYYAELCEACRRSKSFWKSLKIIFGRPEMLDQQIRIDLEKQYLTHRKSIATTPAIKVYLVIQVAGALAGLFFFTLRFENVSISEKNLIISMILITLVNCGALLEQQKWIYNLEVIRLLMATALVGYFLQSFGFFSIGSIIIVIVFTLDSVQRFYFDTMFSPSGEK